LNDLPPFVNQVVISGAVISAQPLRYTPSGCPVAEATLQHQSQCVEAGANRKVEADIPLVAIGPIAEQLLAMQGRSEVQVSGFLSARSKYNRQLVVHVQTLLLKDSDHVTSSV
jgi:primosomal replication protein PriB